MTNLPRQKTVDSLSVAVVGCGRMGKVRAHAATQAGARVRWVCDTNRDVAEELAADLADCRAVESEKHLDWERIDAVFVCTPPSERGAAELSAIEHGAAVFMEKPIGLSAQACEPIRQALVSRPTITAVGYMNRYRESVRRARKQLADQHILAVSGDWLVGKYAVPWWSEKRGSGGPINEQATHMVDLARFLVGDIVTVQGLAEPMPDNLELIGTATFNMKFARGPSFSFLYSCLANTKMIQLTVYTADAPLRLEGWDFRLSRSVGDDDAASGPRNAVFQTEVAAFLQAASHRSNHPVLCDFPDAWKTQCVVDAMHRAIKSGETVSVDSAGAIPD